jgi:nucleoside-diphosphate-sugar epimerase
LRVLVTGSEGFIGPRVVAALLEQGHEVAGLDRERPQKQSPDIEAVTADLLEASSLPERIFDVECVFHLAAARADWGLSREEYFRDNVTATRELIKAGRDAGVRRWVFFSTVGVLGPSTEPLDETTPYAPVVDYGTSKVEAELLFHELVDEDPEAQVLVLRPSAVFGPGQPPNTNIYRLIEVLAIRRFVMVGRGEEPKTTSYIENLTAATLFAFDRLQPGVSTFHYVDTPVWTTADLVRRLSELLGRRPPKWHVPLPLARKAASVLDLAGSAMKRDLPITSARIEKFNTPTNFSTEALTELGFEQPVTMDRALEKTVAWQRWVSVL